ncbi:MAG: AMP-dependent synthetase [Gammaproteobacteria bacterium]|nr:MAG: AMP-dependent synthetase [Gammaproteobacteria bacterium]
MTAHTHQTISLVESLKKTLAMPFCICASGIMNRADLLAHAVALSEKLPANQYAINLCQDRYLFIVAYLAVCIRKHISLLPSNQAPKTLLELKQSYPDSYIISDKQSKADLYISDELLEKSTRPFPLIDIDRPLSISFTSGSTGKPKAIQKSWRVFQASAELALQQFKLQSQQVTLLSTVPMQHMYGLETSLFWVLFSQMALHNSHPFYPQDIRNTLHSVTTPKALVSTPRHLKSCCQTQGVWGDIKFILSSTAPMDIALAKQIEQQLQAPVFELFGSTETLSFASRRTTNSTKWQPYATIQLTKMQQQFVLQGGHIAKAQVLDDNFSIDGNGLFTLLGRSADLIKIAGKRASLSDLNQRLISINGIEDGVFFPSNNERLSALVVSQLPRHAIIQHLKQSIDEVFLPRAVYSVTALPRNAVGKIIKTELEQLIRTCQLVRT